MASYKEIHAAVAAERAKRDARARQAEAERLAVPSFDYLADTIDGIADAARAATHPNLRRRKNGQVADKPPAAPA